MNRLFFATKSLDTMKIMHFFILLTVVAGLFTACKETSGITVPEQGNPFSKYSNQVILDWNVTAYDAMGGATYQHSLLASRINAMTHLAMHDALNAIAPVYQTYAFQEKNLNGRPDCRCGFGCL
ncbi:MAG: hypothetical protein ACK4TA_15040 [Saprospiraceae bacterium]